MKIREKDRTGRLVSSGYEWEETNDFLKNAAIFLGFFGFLAAISFFEIFNSASKWPVSAPLFGLLIGAILLPAAWWAHTHRIKMRSLIFTDDGRTLTPQGLPNFKFRDCTEISGGHAHVTSVEAIVDVEYKSRVPAYVVVLYSQGGDIVYVSTTMHRDDAHKIAVQLTNALKELRESLANPNAVRSIPTSGYA